MTTETETPANNKGKPASIYNSPLSFLSFLFFLLMKALVTNLAFIMAIYKLKQ